MLLCQAALLLLAGSVYGQSTEPTFPTPVGSKEIVGTIAARDIGDARLTDQYYGFTGVPGDFFITVQSRNLNGDFDIFTAGDLRPLLKISVYAESTTPVTKNIYLRRRESLVLRVEGRTPNDDDATYQIRFSGSFEPISGGVLLAESDRQPRESEKQPSKTGLRKGTRVSSAGARIEEPATEVAAAPTPEPTPVATPSPEPEKPAASEPARSTSARNTRGRRPPASSKAAKPATSTETPVKSDEAVNKGTETKAIESGETPPPKPAKSDTKTNNRAAEESKTKPENSEAPKNTTTSRRSNARKGSPARTTKAEPPAESGARLVIEQKNGTRIEWLMSMVKSVTVENGQVVVVRNDGFIERLAMSKVVRMSIGP
jgi:hypothetical protein